MKVFSLILCFYFIALSCMPCMCEDVQAYDKIENQTQQGDDHGKELCTPFCSCSCCISNVFYFQKNTEPIQAIIFHPGKNYNGFVQHFSSFSDHNIWQPPRLG